MLFCFCLIDLPPATCHRLPHTISTVSTLTVSYLSYPILFNALISCVINPLVTSLPLPGSNQRLLQLINPVERAPIQLITHFPIPQTLFPFPILAFHDQLQYQLIISPDRPFDVICLSEISNNNNKSNNN